MSREDATYFFFEKFLDLDTELGISVSGDPQKIRPVRGLRVTTYNCRKGLDRLVALAAHFTVHLKQCSKSTVERRRLWTKPGGRIQGFCTCTWPWRYPHLSETEHLRNLAINAKANIAAKLVSHSSLRRCTLARRRRDPDWRLVSGVSPSSRSLAHSSVCTNAQCRGESLMAVSDSNGVDGGVGDVDGDNNGTHVDDDEVSDQGDQGDYAAQDDDSHIDAHDDVQYDDNPSYPDCDSAPHGYEEYYSYRPYWSFVFTNLFGRNSCYKCPGSASATELPCCNTKC